MKVSPGTIIVGVFAVLFGLVGAYAVRQQLTKKPVENVAAPAPPRPVFVPVAAIDLEPGRPLTLGDVAIVQVSPDQLEARGYTGPYMRDSQQIIGRILRAPVAKGKTFFPELFYPQGQGPSVAERLKPGYRAVTATISNDGAVAGLATPGSLVDVIFRTKSDKTGAHPETTVTLLEGVEVLAVGKVATPGAQVEADGNKRDLTVTLAVTGNQANALRVVEGHGELTLALRNPQDREATTETEAQTLGGLLGLPQPQSFTTEVYRGSKRNTVTFVEPAPQSFQLKQFPVRANVEQPVSHADAAQDTAAANAAPADEVRVATVSQTRSLSSNEGSRPRLGLSGLPLVLQD